MSYPLWGIHGETRDRPWGGRMPPVFPRRICLGAFPSPFSPSAPKRSHAPNGGAKDPAWCGNLNGAPPLVEWCNGSTRGFELRGVGSKPTLTAKLSDITLEGTARPRAGACGLRETLMRYGQGRMYMPKEVIDAVTRIIALGKEAIVRKEKGKWVVLENNRRLIYKEL